MRLKNENDNFKKVNGKQKYSNQVTFKGAVKRANNSNFKLPNLGNDNNSYKIETEEHKKSNQLYSQEKVGGANNKIYNTKISLIDGTEYCEFLDEKSVEVWANDLYGEWFNNLKNMQCFFKTSKPFKCENCSYLNGEDTMLEIYVGSLYEKINGVLRGEELDDKHFYKLLASKLALEIFLAPTLNENIIVYRFLDKNTFEKIKNEITCSGSYIEKGFLSTTLLKDKINKEFERYNKYHFMLKIYVKKGSIGVYTSFCSTLKEYEMLFLNNGIFKKICGPSAIKNNILECVYENN